MEYSATEEIIFDLPAGERERELSHSGSAPGIDGSRTHQYVLIIDVQYHRELVSTYLQREMEAVSLYQPNEASINLPKSPILDSIED